MNPRQKIYACTDLANSERFASDWTGELLYVQGIGWLVYREGAWREAVCGEAVHCAKRTARAIYREAETAPDEFRKSIGEWAVKSEAESRINAMLELAKSDPKIVLPVAKLDADIWALNCLNGTVDLRTGKLKPHNPADHVTKQCPVAYDPVAICPRFLKFLDRIFAGNDQLVVYVQKLLGMACSGDPSSQILPIFWGEGANGKSTLLGIAQHVLGDYAGTAPDSLLVLNARQEHPTEMADLQGKRLVVASETEATAKLRVQLVKKLTGEVTIKARKLYRDYVEFPRTHHLVLQTNNKPRISEDTEAVWRRIKLVPFNVVIPAPERDPLLLDKLKDEASGILAWLVFGCLAWQREGIQEPEEVQDATQHYRADSDPLKDFLDDCCCIGPEFTTKSGDLRRAYEHHCEQQGIKPLSGKALFQRLEHMGATVDRNNAIGRFWRGIGLVNSDLFVGESMSHVGS